MGQEPAPARLWGALGQGGGRSRRQGPWERHRALGFIIKLANLKVVTSEGCVMTFRLANFMGTIGGEKLEGTLQTSRRRAKSPIESLSIAKIGRKSEEITQFPPFFEFEKQDLRSLEVSLINLQTRRTPANRVFFRWNFDFQSNFSLPIIPTKLANLKVVTRPGAGTGRGRMGQEPAPSRLWGALAQGGSRSSPP